MYELAFYNTMACVDISYENQNYNLTSVNQVPRDWETKPFVDLTVTNNTYCPESHPDTVIGRTFFETNDDCDCLGINDQ